MSINAILYFPSQLVAMNHFQIDISVTGVVGEVLRKAGVPVGKKYKLNESLPWIVKSRDKETKRLYLRAIFDDEGCVGRNKFPYLTLARNIHVDFDYKEKEILKKFVVPLIKTNYFSTGHITSRILIE